MFARALITATLLFALMVHSESEQSYEVEYNCWDGSFMYRVATLATEGNFVHIGLKASFSLFSSMTENPVTDDSGLPLNRQGITEANLYIALTKDQCQKTSDKMVCHAVDTIDSLRLLPNLFVGRNLTDLHQLVYVLTPARVYEITVEISNGGIEVSITGQKSGRVASQGKIQFPFRYCSPDGSFGDTHYGNAIFPQILRDYLNS